MIHDDPGSLSVHSMFILKKKNNTTSFSTEKRENRRMKKSISAGMASMRTNASRLSSQSFFSVV